MPSSEGSHASSSLETENCLTRAVTIVALIGFLVVGAAIASILGRTDVPSPAPDLASSDAPNPIANRQSKKDKLVVAASVWAPPETPQTAGPLSDPQLRQAFTAS